MWADWKNKTKKKANILLRKKCYGLDHPTPRLSALEKRLLKIINYPMDNKMDTARLEAVAKVEATDNSDDFSMEFLQEEFNESSVKDRTSSEDEDNASNSYDRNGSEFCDVDEVLKEETKVLEESEADHRVREKDKLSKKKKMPLQEYKERTKLKLEKDRIQQKNEELRLRALELKLKGEELRLKEMEMNKINYLTNIEEEKLKCFRDISASLKEILERSRTGNLRFHNSL
ncbi:uncharacterized protein LOC142977124 isoform X2 [Anticarsia gemmatalis]